MRPLYATCLILSIIGALNWGLWGLFQFDLVASIFDGQSGPISRTLYTIVGLAGLTLAVTSFTNYSSRRETTPLRRAA